MISVIRRGEEFPQSSHVYQRPEKDLGLDVCVCVCVSVCAGMWCGFECLLQMPRAPITFGSLCTVAEMAVKVDAAFICKREETEKER